MNEMKLRFSGKRQCLSDTDVFLEPEKMPLDVDSLPVTMVFVSGNITGASFLWRIAYTVGNLSSLSIN